MMIAGIKAAVAQAARKPVATIRCCGGGGGAVRYYYRRLSTAGGGTKDCEGERQPGSGGDELQRELTPEEVLRVGARTQEMWKDHVALTTEFPDASLPPGGHGASVTPDAVRRKRLVYRSKQRGWLEV
ncbi:unnamed protein product, partial [Ectocarpus sp. 4 AP-2014]